MKKITILFLLSVLIGGLSNGFGQEKIFFSAIPTDSTNLNIYSMNIDGSNQQILFNDDYNRYHPDITNDKSKLVYVRNNNTEQAICKSNIDGSNEETVWTFPDYVSGEVLIDYMDVSNDFSNIIMELYSSIANRNSDIYKLDIATSTLTNLTNSDNYYKEMGVHYSPDNTKIAYGYTPSGWYAIPVYIYIMDADGSNQIQLTSDGSTQQYYPVFSPDGTKILYTNWEFSGHPMRIMNIDGSNDHAINMSSGDNLVRMAVFNPDGTKIIGIRPNETGSLVICDTSGIVERNIPLGNFDSYREILWTSTNVTFNATITIPDTILSISQTVELPITTSTLNTSDNNISYQFNLAYDSTKLQYSNYSLTGTIASGGTATVNNSTPGQLQISYMTSTPLSGAGAILKLQFNPLLMGSSDLTITDFLYNTDTITNIDNGLVTVIGEYGDVDANTHIQAYDAALALQYSVSLDPLPTLDPLPWENFRTIMANVDGVDTVTANDASLILQYSAGLISTFPVEGGTKFLQNPIADITITQVNNELVFTTTGELFGLNISAHSTPGIVLSNPQIMNNGMLSAQNISANNYRIGLCSAYPVAENSEIVRIPFTSTENGIITFNMIVNKEQLTKSIEIVNEATGIPGASDTEHSRSVEGCNIFPNPSNGKVYVNSLTPVKIKVFNILGEQIISTDNGKSNFISVSEKGIYLFEISDGVSTIYKKVVVH